MEFKDIIKKIMDDRGMTQADVCRATGMSDAQVSMLCSGTTKNPRLSTLLQLADGLNCSLDELAGR